MKNVLISLKGFNNEKQQLEFITEGKLFSKKNYYYVTYQESEMTGMEGTTTTIKIKDKEVSLIRHGSVTSNFIFQEGISNTSLYKTEFGEFTIAITAKKINVNMSETGGVIEMDYLLELLDGNNSNNKFYMTIKEVNNNEYH